MLSARRLAAIAAEHDRNDSLARLRDEFYVADPELAYLDGNSLGMPPKRTFERVDRLMRDEWAGGLIRSWEHWLDMPQRVGDQLAPLIGAQPGEVAVHDSTTVNLYQIIRTALRLRPDRSVIAIDPGDFPTDRYVVDSIAAADGLTVRAGFDRLDDVAVAVRSMIDYRTAEITDMVDETARADTRRGTGRVGPLPCSRAAPGRPHGGRRPVGRRVHLQVPQRRTRRPGVHVCRRRPDRPGRRAVPRLVRPVRPVRDGLDVRPPHGHRRECWSVRRACWASWLPNAGSR